MAMSIDEINNRTANVWQRFHSDRHNISNGSDEIISLEQLDSFERLAAGTVYQLRDSKTWCLRLQQEVGNPDPELADAMHRIDELIDSVFEWKSLLRQARQQWVRRHRDVAPDQELGRLASMYQSGMLTLAEFEVLAARLHDTEPQSTTQG